MLDLTDGGAALAGQILGDLGADIVLVEPPGGLHSRSLGPFYDDDPGLERSLEFWSVHRGKRSFVLDLDTGSDRKRFADLVASADVLFDDGGAGRAARAGFDFAALTRIRPDLVHVSITPFGEIGPKSEWAATDLTVTASSMAMWRTGSR